ncbi:titin homolog isoform X9 [Homarus americanus]|uniref:titin homolog isoform X9 n=1 Tax=Homarus americanus TaxID=6706 RepID=UPI001C46428C|nr:titin homolog isoform X9 [Homarus americanus]
MEAGQVRHPHLKVQVDDSTSEEEVLEDEEVLSREIKVDVTPAAVDNVTSSEKVEVGVPSPLEIVVDNSKSQGPPVEAVAAVVDSASDHGAKLPDHSQNEVLPQENQACVSPPDKESQVGSGQPQEEAEADTALPRGETTTKIGESSLTGGFIDISTLQEAQADITQPQETPSTGQETMQKQIKTDQIDSESPESPQVTEPDQKPEVQPPQVTKPEQKPEVQPPQVTEPDQKPEVQPRQVTEPDQKPEVQPPQVTKPEQKPEVQPRQVTEPDQKPEVQPPQVTKPEQKPEVKPPQVTEPEQKPEVQPSQVTEPEQKPEVQPPQVTEPEHKPEVQPPQVTEPEQKPEVQPPQVTEPEQKPEVQPPQVTEPEQKPEVQPSQVTEPEQKPEVKPPQVTEPEQKPVLANTRPQETSVDQQSGNKSDFSDDVAHKEEAVVKAKPTVVKEVTFKLPSESPVSSETGGEEGSSEATETGADISDFVSFAEENNPPVEPDAKALPVEVVTDVPVAYFDQACGVNDKEMEVECRGQETQTSFALPPPVLVTESKEHSTQTEEEKGITVVGLSTSFRHDKDGAETRAGSQGPIQPKVTEILLDALLPSETQLLVKDTRFVDSTPMQNVEIEGSEAGAVPCIVTSHVSLAFLGLEHRDESGTRQSQTLTPVKEGQDAVTSPDNAKNSSKQECKESLSAKHKDLEVIASVDPKVDTHSAPITSPLATSNSTLTSGQIVSDQVSHTKNKSATDQATKITPKDNSVKAINGEGKPSAEHNTMPSAEVNKQQTLVDLSQQALPRPISPVPPRVPEEEDGNCNLKSPTQTLQSREQHEDAAPHPVSPSLEAIAEAVAASTTRAALELLATATTDTSSPRQESQAVSSRPAVHTEEVQSDQSPISTDESSSATTVVAISDVEEDLGASDLRTQSATETLGPDATSKSSTVSITTITHTPSDSPVSTPTEEVTQESVEAALAEAVQEEVPSSTVKSAGPQAASPQKGPEATTVSPQKEDSPTSSKGSSPDMDEYEVITKECMDSH